MTSPRKIDYEIRVFCLVVVFYLVLLVVCVCFFYAWESHNYGCLVRLSVMIVKSLCCVLSHCLASSVGRVPDYKTNPGWQDDCIIGQ